MNTDRRKELKRIYALIEEQVTALSDIEDKSITDYTPEELDDVVSIIQSVEESLADVWSDIESVKDEEEEAFGNIPESLQEKNEANEGEIITALENAMNGDQFIGCMIHEQIDTLQEVLDNLDTAITIKFER